jgi:uncharacterized protein related to proFAR isomerase
MEIIPLIKIRNQKILYDKPYEVLDKLKDNKTVYILDFDGIEKNKPNLCTYQKMSSLYDLWVDFGPRVIGDVVDALMAGAVSITIRKELFPKVSIHDINEISENEIFIKIDMKNNEVLSFNEIAGLVNFIDKKTIEKDYDYYGLLKQLKSYNNKIFSYENDHNNISYWQSLGITGFLVDIDKYEEFKKWIPK